MEEKIYSLMHRDDPVCAISIDPVSGAIMRVSKPANPELLPLGGNMDSTSLKKRWLRRAVPVGLLDLSKLPTEDELRAIYCVDPLIPYVEVIVLGYQKKEELLSEL